MPTTYLGRYLTFYRDYGWMVFTNVEYHPQHTEKKKERKKNYELILEH